MGRRETEGRDIPRSSSGLGVLISVAEVVAMMVLVDAATEGGIFDWQV